MLSGAMVITSEFMEKQKVSNDTTTDTKATSAKRPTVSPLYTPKAVAAEKARVVRSLGPDKDGAFRYNKRLDEAN